MNYNDNFVSTNGKIKVRENLHSKMEKYSLKNAQKSRTSHAPTPIFGCNQALKVIEIGGYLTGCFSVVQKSSVGGRRAPPVLIGIIFTLPTFGADLFARL